MKGHIHSLPAKGYAWMMAMTLAFSAVPSIPAFAEEAAPTEGDGKQSVFVVTEFPEYKKNEDGVYEDKDFAELYTNLKAETGTASEELGLPESISLSGYWETDEAQTLTELELTELTWELKSDELYSTDLPAGSYTFVPDLEAYTLPDNETGDIFIDEIKLADGITAPTLTVVLEDVQTEPETPIDDGTQGPTDNNAQDPPDSGTQDSTGDIISGTDDSLINADGNVYIDGVQSSAPASDPDVNPDEGLMTLELGEDDYNTPSSGAPSSVQDETNDGTAPTDGTDDSTDPADGTGDNDTIAATDDITVSLLITDLTEGTAFEQVSYADENGENAIALKAVPADGENTVSFQLPCNYPLTALGLTVTDTAASNVLSVTEPADYLDFSDGAAKTITLTDAAGASYSLTLTLTNKEHDLSAATCTAAPVCSVCQQTIGTTIPHNYSVPATCIKKATCSMCGAEDPNGQLADHTSSGEATCTTPETCTVCNQVITPALGHDWQDATCTLPKTCERCGATEGKPLGHDLQNDWVIDKESTDTEHGVEIRYCKRQECDYSEERPRNIIGTAERNSISGVSEGANYSLKTAITFTANGSGMANAKPIDGDVRFVPSAWKVQNTPGEFKDNFSGAFSISIAGNYTLTVNFQKQIYQNGGWQNTDTVDSKSVTFSAGNLIQGTPVNGTSDGIRINPQTGDNTIIIPLVVLLVVALLAIIGAILYKKKRK